MSNRPRSKAEFTALRELVGITQQSIASQLGIDVRTVKNWESEVSSSKPNARAWKYIDDLTVQLSAFVALVASTRHEVPVTLKLIRGSRASTDSDIINARIRATLLMLTAEKREFSVEYIDPTGLSSEMGANMRDYYSLGIQNHD